MKISKVDHVKTGVSERPIEAGGMMYSYPDSKKDTIVLREHIKNLTNRTKSLYSAFVSPKTNGGKPGIVAECSGTFNFFIKNNILYPINNRKSDEEILSGLLNADFKARTVRNGRNERSVSENDVNNTVNRCLRQSLRKKYFSGSDGIYIPDVMKKMCLAIYGKTNYKSMISSIPENELKLLIAAIRADYTRENYIEKIANSIEKQNVPIQVSEDGKRIILSSAYNKKKSYIFDFMEKYASCDKAGQEEMLKNMRYLIILFFFGKKVAEDALNDTGFCAWSFGLTLKEYGEEMFSGEVYDLWNTRENIPYSQKADIRNLGDRIKLEYSKALVEHYQEALSLEDLSDFERKWIGYISDKAGKMISNHNMSPYKFTCGYLCERTWEEWISFIAMKYVEMGKGAYNFTMSALDETAKGDQVSFGTVDERYKNGISSFDYERMAAKDHLSRNLATYVSFALNNLDSSVRSLDVREKSGYEDILSSRTLDLLPDAKTKVLRYFGGESSFENMSVKDMSAEDIVSDLVSYFKVTRNSCFHFVSGVTEAVGSGFFKAVFDKECNNAGIILRKRFYSNNVAMFYSDQNISNLMTEMYDSVRNDPAQIPSFNKVVSRNEVRNFLTQLIPVSNRTPLNNAETSELFKNSIYFVLKEIYYHDFLHEKNLMKRFLDAISSLKAADDNEKRAHEAFAARVKIITSKNDDFGSLCQEIMTEYNQQNNQKSKMASAKKDKETGEIKKIENDNIIYKHYVMLLYQGIRQAFYKFIEEKECYAFLKKPSIGKQPEEKDFIYGWSTDMYNVMDVSDPLIQSWYITSHFINQKQLNHLIGQFKNYITYLDSIENRAEQTGNRIRESSKDQLDLYMKLLAVLDFAKLNNSLVSNTLEDYFDDADEYAKYISGFIDFGGDTKEALQAFCNQKFKSGDATETLGKYYDGLNPIMERNIILASMFGNTAIASNVIDRVTEKEVKDFYKRKNKVADLLSRGASSEDDLKAIRFYQNLKNRIELVDMLSITELTNELVSHLTGYAYLRERDLMYMQLGYQYVKLFYTDAIDANNKLRSLDGDCHITDGAVLYQIAAMYSYDLPLYVIDDCGKAVKPDKHQSIGSKVKVFAKEYCKDDYDVYKEGLNLFEDISGPKDGRHNEFIDIRNYIDHMKYFANQKKSILDMYSEMYGGFFSYNTKLKKSVSYVLPNILMADFVVARLGFDKGIKIVGDKEVHVPQMVVKEISTDYLTYKEIKSLLANKGNEILNDPNKIVIGSGWKEESPQNNKGKKAEGTFVAARSPKYCEAVSRLLVYKRE